MPVIHEFDPPERFVVGTVGEPGARTFFIQARAGARMVSVALEKQQVAALAERVDELLDQVLDDGSSGTIVPALAPHDLDDQAPLEQPIEEEFRAGTMTLSWDPGISRVVIEVFPITDEVVEGPERRRRAVRGARAGRGAPGPDHARHRARLRAARRPGGRGGPPELPLLRRADGPCRTPVRAGQRPPPPRGLSGRCGSRARSSATATWCCTAG